MQLISDGFGLRKENVPNDRPRIFPILFVLLFTVYDPFTGLTSQQACLQSLTAGAIAWPQKAQRDSYKDEGTMFRVCQPAWFCSRPKHSPCGRPRGVAGKPDMQVGCDATARPLPRRVTSVSHVPSLGSAGSHICAAGRPLATIANFISKGHPSLVLK